MWYHVTYVIGNNEYEMTIRADTRDEVIAEWRKQLEIRHSDGVSTAYIVKVSN